MNKEKELLKKILTTGWLNNTIYCREVEELLAQPEQTKQEPLSDGTTADMYFANKKARHPDSYWAGVYDAEKAHGIGGV